MDGNNRHTITGRYSLAGCPCTTEPCLPGVAYAVLADGQYFYLTVDGKWISNDRSWGGYSPKLNDLVKITGPLEERTDVFARSFQVIEVISLRPAQDGNGNPLATTEGNTDDKRPAQ